jgi:hypothetical protein
MADTSKNIEITVALLGIAVTGVLGWGQYTLSRQQTLLADNQQRLEQKRAIDNIEVQVMTLVAPYFANLAKTGTEFDASQRVVLAASEYLSTQHQRTALANMASKISEGNSSLSPELKSRIQEATTPVPSGSKWFAVLASVPSSDLAGAQRIANEKLMLSKSQGKALSVQVYKTKISDNFAVVYGGPSERSMAVENSSLAKKNGISKDSFAQQNRDWVYEGEAPFKQSN